MTKTKKRLLVRELHGELPDFLVNKSGTGLYKKTGDHLIEIQCSLSQGYSIWFWYKRYCVSFSHQNSKENILRMVA